MFLTVFFFYFSVKFDPSVCWRFSECVQLAELLPGSNLIAAARVPKNSIKQNLFKAKRFRFEQSLDFRIIWTNEKEGFSSKISFVFFQIFRSRSEAMLHLRGHHREAQEALKPESLVVSGSLSWVYFLMSLPVYLLQSSFAKTFEDFFSSCHACGQNLPLGEGYRRFGEKTFRKLPEGPKVLVCRFCRSQVKVGVQVVRCFQRFWVIPRQVTSSFEHTSKF